MKLNSTYSVCELTWRVMFASFARGTVIKLMLPFNSFVLVLCEDLLILTQTDPERTVSHYRPTILKLDKKCGVSATGIDRWSSY